MLRSENRDVDESRALSAIDALSTRLAELSEHLLAIAQDETNKMTLSPYLPYVLYQTAVVQDRLWKQKNEVTYKQRAETMVTILKCFSKRWHVAGQCDPRRNFTHWFDSQLTS